MTQFTYTTKEAYDVVEEQSCLVALSQPIIIEKGTGHARLAHIIDDLHNNVSVVSITSGYTDQPVAYIVEDMPFYTVDAPYHTRYRAEQYVIEDEIEEAKASGAI
jgi:hypothetical protein